MKKAYIAVLAALWLVACDSRSPGDARTGTHSPVSTGVAIPQEIARKQIAFMDERRLFTANADGSDRRLIARVPHAYSGPYWSAAARRFLVRAETKHAGYIYVINEDGSKVTNVSRKAGSRTDAMAAWSPDGRQIVFTSRREGDEFPQLYRMDADGSNVVRLTDGTVEAQYPAWSPDGKRIAFTGVLGTQGNNFDIFTMDADGRHVRRVTDTPEPENWATWSPDSTTIAFSVEGADAGVLWAANLDGTGRRRLTDPNVVSAGEPNWSRSVDWVTFDCTANPSPAQICAIRGDGTGLIRLFGHASFPFWMD
jgi:TolB protein